MTRQLSAQDTSNLDRVQLGPREPGWRAGLLRLLLALLAASGGLWIHGFYVTPVPAWSIRLGQLTCLGVYWIFVWRLTWRLPRAMGGGRLHGFEYSLIGLTVVAGALHLSSWRYTHGPMLETLAGVVAVMELWRMHVRLSRSLKRPGLLLPMSFLGMIVVGTVLLKLPVAVPDGQTISWLDALFTMTSAVCVTGLAVRDTATQFTAFGQIIIGVFIQLGGLGIIIFGSMLALLLGRRLSLRENVSLSQMLNDQPMYKLTDFVRFIVLATLVIELIGAALLYPQWQSGSSVPLSVSHRVGLSLFHAVSAFCNAGFDLLGHSLVSYRYAMLTHAVLVPLIVVGGLGFPVLMNLRRMATHRIKRWVWRDRYQPNLADLSLHRMSLHTKLVLSTTAVLYLVGVLGIGISQAMPHVYEALDLGQTAHQQRPDSLTWQSVGAQWADASFMSVTARTAGFTSMPMDELQPGSRLVLMSLMFVGGSPGSTAGGVKTTVIAVLVLGIAASIRQRKEAQAFGRTLDNSLHGRAGALFLLYGLMMTVATFLLLLSEPFAFEAIFFEVVSAATTTGLSLGITEDLTRFGKGVIIATMFLGRVGPLALLGALVFSRRHDRPYAYPHEQVLIG